MQITDLNAKLSDRVAYHPSCHGLRNLGLCSQAGKLLDKVKGLEVKALPEADVCCGFGGLFALKMSDISGTMLNRKLDNLETTGAKTLVGADMSCLMQIGGGLKKRGINIQVKHIADVLCEGCQEG